MSVKIGALVYPRMDQLDFTGPFEVLSQIAGAEFRVIWKDAGPLRDVRGLVLTADTAMEACPQLDVLVVPGGLGQQDLMEDEEVLAFVRRQAAGTRFTLSVCTGALICGAAGLLRGRKATTHWSALELLQHFGATAVNERVVVDGNFVSTAGVTAGIDGALEVVRLMFGDEPANLIQVFMEYRTEAIPEEAWAVARERAAPMVEARREMAKKVGAG